MRAAPPAAVALLAVAAIAAVAIAGCGGGSGAASLSTSTTGATPGFHLQSPAFRDGQAIPSAYTCNGAGAAPPLSWSGVPKGTRELVLVMRDPDAPGGAFVHWALAGIAPGETGLPAPGAHDLVPGQNGAGTVGYTPPCPPPGDSPHHYVLTLSALGTPSGLRAGWSASELHARALGTATLTGTDSR